jgi:hypothetical protein
MVRLEDIIGVVQGVKGRTDDIVFDLFFSDKRVVAAVVLYFSDFTDIYEKTSLGTLLFGNLGERREIKVRSLKLMYERRQAFENKTLDEILTLHRANFEMDYADVVSVIVRKGLLETTLEFAVLRRPEKKISFRLEKRQVAEVEGLINRVLPDKMQ